MAAGKKSRSGRTVLIARVLAVLLGALLVLFWAVNLDIFWERGLEVFLPGSKTDVGGVATDVFSMVSARDLVFEGRLPAAPSLKIAARDIFLSYDPLLRRHITVEMRYASVEGRVLPVREPAGLPLPLLGLFRGFLVRCLDADFRILWSDYSFSCEGSRLSCESPEGEDGSISWEVPRLTVRRGDDLMALMDGVEATVSFAREGAICSSPLVSGRLEIDIGRVELEMEPLSDLGNRRRLLVTGKFTGAAHLALEDGRVTKADAILHSEGGGNVSISRDFIEGYIGRMELGPKQDSMKIVLESLRDYPFNSGGLAMNLIEDTILLDVDLDGESGPRHIVLNLEGFLDDGRIVGNPLISTGR